VKSNYLSVLGVSLRTSVDQTQFAYSSLSCLLVDCLARPQVLILEPNSLAFPRSASQSKSSDSAEEVRADDPGDYSESASSAEDWAGPGEAAYDGNT
jgi:hypothetical protein